MDLACEWFTDQSGLTSRPFVVDIDDVLGPVKSPAVSEVVDIDADDGVVFDSDATAPV